MPVSAGFSRFTFTSGVNIMGVYFNPVHKLPEVGRRITTESHDYIDVKVLLFPGEHLFIMVKRLEGFAQAPELYSENEFREFYRQVGTGHVQFMGFYAVSDECYQQYCNR
jgi:hypothetical protein